MKFKQQFIILVKIISFYLLAVYVGKELSTIALINLLRKAAAHYTFLWPSIHSFLMADYGRLPSRVASFIGVMVIYLLFLIKINKGKINGSVLWPSCHKATNFLNGSILGSALALIAIAFTLGTQAVILTPKPGYITEIMPILILNLFCQILTPITEELIMRGYVLHYLSKIINPHLAVIITATVFGGWHLQYSLLYAFNATLFGLIVGYGYLITRNIYYCVGIHFSTNFLQEIAYSQGLFNIHVHNALWAGDRNITPDRDGLITFCVASCIFLLFFWKKKIYRYNFKAL